MGVDVIQLKLLRESFYVVFGKLAPLSAVVLREGHSGTEVAKRILKKMESEGVIGGISLKVGFTDVGGRDNVPRMLDAILSLARSSRRLKDIVVVVDGDEYSVDDRVKSIVDSLASREALIEGLQRDGVSNQVYISRGEGSRIGAPGGYGVRALGRLRDVRVFSTNKVFIPVPTV